MSKPTFKIIAILFILAVVIVVFIKYRNSRNDQNSRFLDSLNYSSKTVIDKFEEIDKNLKESISPKTAEDSAIDRYLDSVRNVIIKNEP